jgi:transcriptional regulator with XRE-family HTH domain
LAVHADTQSYLAARIAAQRKERGLTQRQLADAIGIDPSSMSRVEKGQRAVSVGELVQLAAVLDVRVEDLLEQAAPVSSIWLRATGEKSPGVAQSLDLFRSVIRDFFGAEATVE